MKNIVLTHDAVHNVPLAAGEHAVRTCLNPSDPLLYVATSYCDIVCWHLDDCKVVWRESIGASAGPDSQVMGFAFSLDLDAITIGLSTGELLVLSVESQQVEEVGAIEGGIMALEWSPDGEVFVIASAAGKLLLMNQDWELLSELSLPGAVDSDPDAAAFKDIRLTWRGDGKFFATVHREQQDGVSSCKVSIWERGSEGCHLHAAGEAAPGLLPVLAWQPNGRHLYVAQQPPPVQQQSTAQGQAVPATRQTLRERAGATAAVKAQQQLLNPMQTDGAHPLPYIKLYERNGLQHGGFDLRSHGHLEALAWSPDSELLAVVQCVQPTGEQAQASQPASWSLQVYHRSNWHWYLKLERTYSPAAGVHDDGRGPPLLAQWDERHGGRLHVLAPGGAQYEQLQVLWDVTTSDRGTVAVVDGSHVLLTPVRHAMVPPPMCAVRAILPASVVAVCVSSSCVREDEAVAAVMSDGRVGLLRSVEADLWEETQVEQAAVAEEEGHRGVGVSDALCPLLPRIDDPTGAATSIAGGRRVRAVCWAAANSLVVVAAPGLQEDEHRGDMVVEYAVSWPSEVPEEDRLPSASAACSLQQVATSVVAGGHRVLRCLPHPEHGVLLELENGELRHYTAAGGSATVTPGLVALPRTASFPVACERVTPAPTPPNANQATLRPAVGLSAAGDLYWGNTKVAHAVTSMCVRVGGAGGPALLYVTRTNLLYTVFFKQLATGGFVHRELTEEAAGGKHMRRPQIEQDGLRAAMHAAMRPDAASAAARDTGVRAVEQGAALVTCPRDGVELVLQMPRGNLEGVSPRALVLAAVAAALTQRHYATAWSLATINRVDLNLLVDWGWPSFLAHAPEFVREVPLASDLCDLLTALQPASCCTEGGLYANIPMPQPSLGQLPQDGGASDGEDVAAGAASGSNGGEATPVEEVRALAAQGKVNAVCTAIRRAVQAQPSLAPASTDCAQGVGADGVGRALPGSAAAAASRELLAVVVTSYARSDPPQLGDALAAVRDAKETALASAASSARGDAVGVGPAERALRALLLHVDVDALYREALGLYELPLAFMVITHAQKDPGEYAAELSHFAAIADTNLRRHAIDVHLRRWESALRHLVAAGPHTWDQALALAKERGLLRQLLALCDAGAVPAGDAAAGTTRRRAVLVALGGSLEGASKSEDAALAYLAAGALEDALRTYRMAGQWRQALIVAGRLGLSRDAVTQLAVEMADDLSGPMAQPSAAAQLLLSYTGDVDNSVSLFARARDWREAMRVSYAHGRADLVPTVVAPAAAEAAAALLGEAREGLTQVTKYFARLKDVRAKRLALDEALKAAADAEGGAGVTREELADGASDAGVSVLTGLSLYTENTYAATGTGTGASTRAPSTLGGRKAQKANDRRAAKTRKGRVRQGSPEEEASLVDHVLTAGPSAAVLTDAGVLCEALVVLEHEQDARRLQAALSAWAAAHKDAVDDIRVNPLPLDNVPSVFKSILAIWGLSATGPSGSTSTPSQHAASAGATADIAWKWDILRAA